MFLQSKNGVVESAMLFPEFIQAGAESALFGRVGNIEAVVVDAHEPKFRHCGAAPPAHRIGEAKPAPEPL
jgi:hypothetical protein